MRPRRPALDRNELLVLASGLFLFVPGARAVWGWPWLWAVPGWFFARRVLGVRGGFLLPALSLVTSIAVSSLVCLPLTILLGGPRTWAVVASIALFAVACSCARAPARPLPSVPAPPMPALALAGAFVAYRAAVAIAEAEVAPSGPDGWYLEAVVRELATTFPPSNPVAATTILKQPWGYWLLYALTESVTHLSIASTLQLASLLLAVAFLAGVHLLATTLADDARAGGLAIALALGASELLWIEELASSTTARLGWETLGVTSFPMNLVDAFYDVPVLVVALAVLWALAAQRPLLAAAFLAIAPLFHPVHAMVVVVAVVLALAFEGVRGRLTRSHAWLLAAPAPFLVLYVIVYAHGMAAHAAFVPTLTDIGARLAFFVRWGGLFVPLAIAGAARTSGPMRSTVVVLFALASALAIFAFAANYHWSADLLATSMAVLGGVGLSALAGRAGRMGPALAIGIVALGLVGADYPARFAPRRDRRSDDERAAARWIREATPRRAIFAVDHRATSGIATALGLGERRLFFGPSYQLANTMSASELDARAEANLASLRQPCVARENGVDFVLLERHGAESRALAAWQAAGVAPSFENDAIHVYDVARAGCR